MSLKRSVKEAEDRDGAGVNTMTGPGDLFRSRFDDGGFSFLLNC